MKPNVAAAFQALSHLDVTDNPPALKAQSRDFFWYSPVLKARLDHVVADFAVSPQNEAEVIEVLKTCYAHDVPVTTRGAGTGNYGQAMPLAGGCVLNLKKMTAVRKIAPGRVVCEPGIIMRDLDRACVADSGQELRMFPSTRNTAAIGGFIAGGSGGVGSVRWGVLRDLGNILRLRVVTMEAEPRILEFTHDELHRVSHAYGTNGVITEIEMPLTAAYDWVEVMLTFDDFPEAAAFTDALANEDGILIKLATVVEAPAPHACFLRLKDRLAEGDNMVIAMIAPHAMDAFQAFCDRRGGARLLYRSDDNDWDRGPGEVFEYTWNHTTLRALRVDPSITYLQVRYDFPDHLDKIEAIRARFGDELMQHLEFMRVEGKVAAAGLTMVRFTTEERLDEIIAIHEEMGCPIFNPHRYTLEEGGRQSTDATQLNFKREADPKGLLNPGKMISWDDPDWTYDRMYAWPGLMEAPA